MEQEVSRDGMSGAIGDVLSPLSCSFAQGRST